MPFNLVVKVDAVGQGSFVESDILHELRVAIGLLDAQRLAQGTVFNALYLDIAVDGDGVAVDGLLLDFPCRPCKRLTVVEDDKAQRFSLGNKLPAVALVDDRRDVALSVDGELIDRVLDVAMNLGLDGAEDFLGGLDAIDGGTCGRHIGIENEMEFVVLVDNGLRGHALAFLVEYLIGFPVVNADVGQSLCLEGFVII